MYLWSWETTDRENPRDSNGCVELPFIRTDAGHFASAEQIIVQREWIQPCRAWLNAWVGVCCCNSFDSPLGAQPSTGSALHFFCLVNLIFDILRQSLVLKNPASFPAPEQECG